MKLHSTLGLLTTLLLALPAYGSEDEAWLQRAGLPPQVRPLLALLVDTSQAMSDRVQVLPPYDPSRDYTTEGVSSCRRDRVYWRLGPGAPPACDGAQWISLDATSPAHGWRCGAGRIALDAAGVFIAARAAQWQARGSGGYWSALLPGEDGAVECRVDRGRHGAGAGTWYAADGEGGPWLNAADQEPDWEAPPLSNAYAFFTGNYLAWLASAERIETTRYEWLARRIVEAAGAAARLDLALARFSHDGLGGDDEARGGMLPLAPVQLPEDAASIGALLGGWTPGGPAPIAEALAELTRWLRGAAVGFGETSQAAPGVPLPSAPGTRSASDPSSYQTPFDHACRPVVTAIATAGHPTADASAGEAVRSVVAAGTPACTSDCAVVLTEDITRGDLLASLPGRQRAAVRWLLPAGPDSTLVAATRAAGSHPLDLDAPWSILALVTDALQQDAAEPAGTRLSAAGLESRPFVAPDQSTYFALSKPEPRAAWPGNLRRYRLAPSLGAAAASTSVGRDDEPVFDDQGRLRPGSWSEWSATPDGAHYASGGAAANLPRWDARRVFSDLVDAPLTDPANRVSPGNPMLTRVRLGLSDDDTREPAVLVEWLLGRDALDEDFDGDEEEPRHGLGDAGLRAPRILRYAPGGAALAFLPTNDGVLHAIDAETGTERWAFVPSALLPQMAERSEQGTRFSRVHGLDGPVALLVRDADQDGRIEPGDGDEAWLFIALGRGGIGYYGLDVTDIESPRLLWKLGASELPGFGQSWPAPVPARMWLDTAAQGDDSRVLVLSGGHDPAEDAAVPPATSRGAGLALVSARSGATLWRAGGTGDPHADLEVTDLRRSLPAAPRVLDTDGDGLHDVAYVLDAGGQLLRFDFTHGASGSARVSARRIADLGSGPGTAPPRRFQVTPDAVLETRQGREVLALAFGSGWASRPRSGGAEDRFYVVFDALGATAARPVLREPDLTDVTDGPATVAPDAPGWMFRLAAHGDGERVTGNSLTFDHRVRFTTYQPLPPAAEAPCGPPAGVARLYTLDIRDGSPVNHLGDRPVPDEVLDLEGLAPGLVVSFPGAAPPAGCAGAACRRLAEALLGGRRVPLDFRNDPVRTSWRQLDADGE